MVGRVRGMPGDNLMSRLLHDFPQPWHHGQEREESRKPEENPHHGQATTFRSGQSKSAAQNPREAAFSAHG